MFNNLQHQLMCEIEGLENASAQAREFCIDEQWEYMPECMRAMFKRFSAAFKICQQLGLIQEDKVETPKVEIIENPEIIVTEKTNA